MSKIDEPTQTELEAAAFRRLVSHLRDRPDVQNIDMMNLANFCRNCLSNWYKDAANEKGIEKSIVFEAMEQALASATKKRYEDEEPEIEEQPYDRARLWRGGRAAPYGQRDESDD